MPDTMTQDATTTPTALLAGLRARGFKPCIYGNALKGIPHDQLRPGELDTIRAHRVGIFALLEEEIAAAVGVRGLPLSSLRTDGETQIRAGMDEPTLERYGENIDRLPAVVAFFDGASYWLADGFHR